MIALVHTFALLVYSVLIVFHVALAPVIFDEISFRLVWYLGTDLGSVGFVAVNVIAMQTPVANRLVWRICLALNAVFIAFAILNLVAVPQFINVFVLIVVVTITVAAALKYVRAPA